MMVDRYADRASAVQVDTQDLGHGTEPLLQLELKPDGVPESGPAPQPARPSCDA